MMAVKKSQQVWIKQQVWWLWRRVNWSEWSNKYDGGEEESAGVNEAISKMVVKKSQLVWMKQ